MIKLVGTVASHHTLATPVDISLAAMLERFGDTHSMGLWDSIFKP
jgi:hypothetical protein